MQEIKLAELQEKTYDVLRDILLFGETVKVDVNSSGEVVIMREPEYNIMCEALQALSALDAAIEQVGKLNIYDLLQRHKKLRGEKE